MDGGDPVKRHSIAAAAAVVVLAAGGAHAVTARATTPQPARTLAVTDTGPAVAVSSCVIRWRAAGASSEPYLYVNDSHPCPGVAGVAVDSSDGDVIVTPEAGVVPVLYAAATPDETYARMGIIAGASVGSTLTVRFSRKGVAMRGDDPVLVQSTGNLWLLVVSSGRAAA